jgi:hypothetical protein
VISVRSNIDLYGDVRLKIIPVTGVIGVSYVCGKRDSSRQIVRAKLHGATRAYGGSEFEDLRALNFYSRWSFVVSLNFSVVTFPLQQLEGHIGHPVHRGNQSRSFIM